MADHAAEKVVLPAREQELKLAIRELCHAFGGQDAVAARYGKRQQRISEMGLPDHPSWMPLPWVADLEACTVGLPGHPHVTRLLARRAGFLLVDQAQADRTDVSPLGGIAAIAVELGDLSRVLGIAMADGEMGNADRAAALTELIQLEAEAAKLRVALESGVSTTEK